MVGITKIETRHGNPGESRILPAGLRVYLTPAVGRLVESDIAYWASPLDGESDWPETLMVKQLTPLGIDLVAECGGYSLYDRMLPEGWQMLCNVSNLEFLWQHIFQLCRLARN